MVDRESQTAGFFRDGRSLDAFGSGRHSLTTLTWINPRSVGRWPELFPSFQFQFGGGSDVTEKLCSGLPFFLTALAGTHLAFQDGVYFTDLQVAG